MAANEHNATRDSRPGQIAEYLRRHSDRPVPAIELAQMLRLEGDRESQRRAVRKVIADMRDAGYRICAGQDADGNGGYWKAASAAEWAEYLAAVKNKAKYAFALVRKRQEAVIDRESGQGRLFGEQGSGTEGLRDSGKALQWA